MTLCACGSHSEYNQCCGLYHRHQAIAPSPEVLMRSRYCAYTMANLDYIKQTMRGKPLLGFDALDAAKWAERVSWLGLKVVASKQECDDKGYVEFIARYREDGQVKQIHEISVFERHEGNWFYVDGVHPAKKSGVENVPRNALCPCGSQSKYKNCHGKGV